MGVWELRRLMVKLFQLFERFHNIGQAEEIGSHLASFLFSFANIILQLDKFDELFIENLEKVIGALFMSFPQLFEAQRKLHYRCW